MKRSLQQEVRNQTKEQRRKEKSRQGKVSGVLSAGVLREIPAAAPLLRFIHGPFFQFVCCCFLLDPLGFVFTAVGPRVALRHDIEGWFLPLTPRGPPGVLGPVDPPITPWINLNSQLIPLCFWPPGQPPPWFPSSVTDQLCLLFFTALLLPLIF